MNSKVKNIIIFSVIVLALILGYFIFANKKSSDESLVSSSGDSTSTADKNTETSSTTNEVGEDFIAVLLNVKNLKLDDSILSDTAFSYLKDSSIYLIPEGNEGRTNPFAPIGSDTVSSTTISNFTGILGNLNTTEKADSSSNTEKTTDNTVVNTKSVDTTKQN